MAQKARRTVYDKNYYKAEAMVRDLWFQEQETWLKKRFADVGCPLPEPPFTKYKEYMDWNDRFWKRFSEMERSPEYAAAVQRITSGRPTMTADEFYALEDFRNEYLPPLYGQVFDEILRHFRIPSDDRGFRDFLESYFFFGQKTYGTAPFGVVWKLNEKTKGYDLFVEIYPHTKREDLIKHWEWIATEQKRMKDFMGKSKAWQTFDRDMEIYVLYKKLRQESGKKRHDKWHATDAWIYSDLHTKYPALTTENIRTIIKRTRKRLGDN